MKHALMLGITISAGFSQTARAQAVPADVAAQDQWFTGTLEAPSPALAKSGLLLVKPYAILTHNDGTYDGSGDFHAASGSDTFKTVELIKYGITDRLSLQVLPTLAHIDNRSTHYTGFADLPIEAEYRLTDGSPRTGFPSITVAAGLNVPIGRYDNFKTASAGFGTGALALKEQVLLQSLFDTAGGHAMRLRAYVAAYQPLGTASVANISAYGTGQGFAGRVKPGASVVLGIGGGYAFDRRWVVAMDLVYQTAQGFALDGDDPAGSVHTKSGRSSTTSFAPAVEYNLSSRFGIIAGVNFSLAGQNSASYFAPQVAISMTL